MMVGWSQHPNNFLIIVNFMLVPVLVGMLVFWLVLILWITFPMLMNSSVFVNVMSSSSSPA